VDIDVFATAASRRAGVAPGGDVCKLTSRADCASCRSGGSPDICDYDVFTGGKMAAKGVFTVRVSSELQDRLDAIAEAIDRPRSWVVNRALEAFVASETWQIEEIRRGLSEADAGEFATDAEIEAIFEKWQRIKSDAD
jgi:RHH-type rel operon transcriptional repressor/antitoxin RelB